MAGEFWLPMRMSGFAARSEVEVRLWLEAREISAAGYRLYVFYP